MKAAVDCLCTCVVSRVVLTASERCRRSDAVNHQVVALPLINVQLKVLINKPCSRKQSVRNDLEITTNGDFLNSAKPRVMNPQRTGSINPPQCRL